MSVLAAAHGPESVLTLPNPKIILISSLYSTRETRITLSGNCLQKCFPFFEHIGAYNQKFLTWLNGVSEANMSEALQGYSEERLTQEEAVTLNLLVGGHLHHEVEGAGRSQAE